jgi:hypothetical protein
VIPYVGWYALIVWSLIYFLLYNPEHFKGLQKYIIVTQAVAMTCYILFPTRQDLRPAAFERNNFLTWIMGAIYSFDTNTGVCPSLHVAYSIGIASTWLKEKKASKWAKAFVVIFVILVCLSVSFTKQHSVVDVLADVEECSEFYEMLTACATESSSEGLWTTVNTDTPTPSSLQAADIISLSPTRVTSARPISTAFAAAAIV